MAAPSIAVRILASCPHPRLEGVTLQEGERYVLKVPDAFEVVRNLAGEVDADDVTAPMVQNPAELVKQLQAARADILEANAAEMDAAEEAAATELAAKQDAAADEQFAADVAAQHKEADELADPLAELEPTVPEDEE